MDKKENGEEKQLGRSKLSSSGINRERVELLISNNNGTLDGVPHCQSISESSPRWLVMPHDRSTAGSSTADVNGH